MPFKRKEKDFKARRKITPAARGLFMKQKTPISASFILIQKFVIFSILKKADH